VQGFILTGLEEYAQQRFGIETVREVFAKAGEQTSRRPAAWEYVSFDDFSAALDRLAARTGVPRAGLLKGYGRVLFQTLVHLPLRLSAGENVLDYLETLETGVYEELADLIPHVECPRLECRRLSHDSLELAYHSRYRLGDLAEGLLMGSIDHFRDGVSLRRCDDPGDSGRVTFVLTRD
jgi:hypothetical protein